MAGCLKAEVSLTGSGARLSSDERPSGSRGNRRSRLRRQYLASQQQTAEDKTADLDRQIRVLDRVLTDSLSWPPLTFQQLKVSLSIPGFDPGLWGSPAPEPEWAEYAPIEPKGLGRLFGGSARYEREMTSAQGRFEAAKVQHRQDEEQRLRALALARAEYEHKVAEDAGEGSRA